MRPATQSIEEGIRLTYERMLFYDQDHLHKECNHGYFDTGSLLKINQNLNFEVREDIIRVTN